MARFIEFAKTTGLYVKRRGGRCYMDIPGNPFSSRMATMVKRLAQAARAAGLNVEEGVGRLYLVG